MGIFSSFKRIIKNKSELKNLFLIKKSKYFNKKWYLNTYPDVKKAKIDPALHYLKYGWKEGRNPSGMFDNNLYLNKYKYNANPLVHYECNKKSGKYNVGYNKVAYKLIKKSNLFDAQLYETRYGINGKLNIDPIVHYLTLGWKKGYNPSDKFNTNYYLENNQDVNKVGICPLVHYIKYGKAEGRSPLKNGILEEYKEKKFIPYFARKFYRFINYGKIKRNKDKNILVCYHLYYPLLWENIKRYLKNLSCYNYTLFITHTDEIPDNIIKSIKEFKRDCIIKYVENKGFDIGPFVYTLNNVEVEKYDVVFKIHTKRDVIGKNYYGTYLKGKEWRELLLSACMGERSIHSNIDLIVNNSDIGMIAESRFVTKHDLRYNKSYVYSVMNKYNLEIPDEYKFIMGSMFVANPKIFNGLLSAISYDVFEPSKRGFFTIAHAYERIISLHAMAQGYKILGRRIFYYYTPIRYFQSKFTKFHSIYFVDKSFVNDTEFYFNRVSSKTIAVSSLLKQVNEKLYNDLLDKGRMEAAEEYMVDPDSMQYAYLITKMVNDNILAEIKSRGETTIFRKLGDLITVEKINAYKTYSRMIIKSQKEQRIYKGQYMYDLLKNDIIEFNIDNIVKQLIPFIEYSFNYFNSNKKDLLKPESWDAMPNNAIIENKKYKYYDTNIIKLSGVSKNYFIFRTALCINTLAQDYGCEKSKNNGYTSEIYNSLIKHFNMKNKYEQMKQEESFCQLSLKRTLPLKKRYIELLRYYLYKIYYYFIHKEKI